ncbi:hypothetical protein [Paracoccus litorisediminis]|uniref:Uncharacterized protein n=1 Tax=Paracoccus litorisediminis TaxID=2006130 RepID=A0A844HSJ0_9RHOB|nr:hypothetical protein [Paracoccus litorisediminis]MTH61175.1 hypothetical protein [Paracoccus litorisediminis]
MTALVTVAKVTLPDSIALAYANSSEVVTFATKNEKKLTPGQQARVAYAMARATYRDGEDLLAWQIALLAETGLKKIQHYARKLFGEEVEADTLMSNGEASKILTQMMDM